MSHRVPCAGCCGGAVSGPGVRAAANAAAYDAVCEHLVAAPLSLVLHWRNAQLREITLRWHDAALGAGHAAHAGGGNSVPEACPDMEPAPVTGPGRALHEALAAYVAGVPVRWPDLPLDMSAMTPFARAVLTTLRHNVPYGQTITYAGLAALAGRPGAARGVGQVMARNPWVLIVPCHRVLGGCGTRRRLHGFSGAGLPMKRWLLVREGAIDATVRD